MDVDERGDGCQPVVVPRAVRPGGCPGRVCLPPCLAFRAPLPRSHAYLKHPLSPLPKFLTAAKLKTRSILQQRYSRVDHPPGEQFRNSLPVASSENRRCLVQARPFAACGRGAPPNYSSKDKPCIVID